MVQHDTTAASQQGLPAATFLMKNYYGPAGHHYV